MRSGSATPMAHRRCRSRARPATWYSPPRRGRRRGIWSRPAAERGGGLVCWLESLRALLAAPPLCDVVFTANSGHELGHLGLDEFIARRPGWEQPVAAGGAVWVHYGANIGAVGGELAILSTSEDLRTLA